MQNSNFKLALITAAFFVVSAAPKSLAQGGGGKLNVACGQDIQKLCAGTEKMEARKCLRSHRTELSGECKAFFQEVRARGGIFRAACGQDVQRFCVGVQPGGRRLVQCLSSHTREVSAACGNMIAAIHARRGTPNSSVQSPAALPAAPVTVGKPPATMGSILRASCGPDAQRLCAGARTESVVLKCLDSQRMELSTICSSYFQKLGAATQ